MTRPSLRSGTVEPDLAEPESEPDAALVELARAGDRAAFGALHARFARPVHGLLLAHVAPADADDLLQDVFLSAWRRLEQLREPGSFGPWLLAIARNAATGAARRARPLQALDELEHDVASAPREATADGVEILAMLRELPQAYRETLALRLVEGLSGPEIAAATGLTHGSVRVNLHRGMQLLRERLRREGYA
jgi:RNA polymerase sigma-70 factor (ECF subfamily)